MKRVMVDDTVIHTDNKIIEGRGMHGSGTVTKVYEDAHPLKSMCAGCEDDFYNDRNPYGVKECWAFRSAKVVNKVGYSSIHRTDGPDTIMKKTLGCWHGVRK